MTPSRRRGRPILDRIEARQKDIDSLKINGKLPVKAGLDPKPFFRNIEDVIDRIRNGWGLPDEYCRRSTGRDHLLEDHGWIHLHIGHDINDDVLLIVEQTETHVILIAITDHEIFEEIPPADSVLQYKKAIEARKQALAAATLRRLRRARRPRS